MNVSTEGLPPEMQARINDIIQTAKAGATIGTTPQAAMVGQQPAPAPRPPSLMDHVIALRQEVAQLGQMVQAQGQVTEAVGNAVGQMYSMFQESAPSPTYSSGFETAQPSQVDDF